MPVHGVKARRYYIKLEPNNKTVSLPLQDHIIKAWPEHNFLVSIIQNKPTAYDWIMNTYIQSYASHWRGYGFEDRRVTFYPYGFHSHKTNVFDLCPFITKYAIPWSMVNDMYAAFSDFIIYAIDHGFYLSCSLDQFFIPGMDGETGFTHPNYFYGYDVEKQLVFLVDNLKDGKYTALAVSFTEINTAFNLLEDIHGQHQFFKSTFLYELVNRDYIFDLSLLLDQLKDYLEPGGNMCYMNRFLTLLDNNSEILAVYFGIDCYKLMHNYLEEIIELHKSDDLDWRAFVYLCDHKKLMRLRVEYLMRQGYLPEDQLFSRDCIALERECKMLLNLFLKYHVTKNMQHIQRALNILETIKAGDRKIITSLIQQLERYQQTPGKAPH